MPSLNNNKSGMSMQNDFSNKLNNLDKKIENVKNNLDQLNAKLNKIDKFLDDIKDINERLASVVSYTDKSRLNLAIKNITNHSKQMNMTKTSKLMKNINECKERIRQIEDSMVSCDDSD